MKWPVKHAGDLCLAAVCVVILANIVIELLPREPTRVGAVKDHAGDANQVAPESVKAMDLIVMTLNVAHGRKDRLNQMWLKRETIKSNLDDIAEVLRHNKPDVVALQEADGPSIWSGNFNHVQHLADRAQMPYAFRGEHVHMIKLSYGTALLSQIPLRDSNSITFAPSPPTFSKGFVVSSIQWPGDPDFKVDVVSVHLDFSRSSVRKKQVQSMIEHLENRDRPLIVMGDFNCSWDGKDPSLRTLADKLHLKPYQPLAPERGTYPSTGKRLDWILISPELEFVKYENSPATLSDHLGVVAVLKRL